MEDSETSWRDDFTLKRAGVFVVLSLVLAFVLPAVQANAGVTESVATQVAARKASKATLDELTKSADGTTVAIRVTYDGPEQLRDEVVEQLRHDAIELSDAPSSVEVRASAAVGDGASTVTYALTEGKPSEGSARLAGWEAVLPPLVAILVALAFRQLLLALALAIWIGATALAGWNPLIGLADGAVNHVWGSVSDTFNAYIIGFTLSLVGMVQVVTRMGGISGLLEQFAGLVQSVRSARVTTALLGTAIFFDDYANTVVVGTTMRPVTDAKGISREKLAYLVDSMSAPIAGIAIISTWVGYEVGLFDELAGQLALGRSGYDIFFSIIPMRFYCLLTIVFVFLNAWLGRDFGPMLTAERRAHGGDVIRPGAKPLTSAAFSSVVAKEDIPHRWYNAFIPVSLVIVATVLGMFWSGWSGPQGAAIPAIGAGDVLGAWGGAAPDLFSWTAWRGAFSNADGAKVLFFASMLGSVVALALAVGQRLLGPGEALGTFLKAIPAMWMAIAILVMAWSIRSVCDDLGTSIYLVGAVRDFLAPAVLPVATFGLAAVVAFATGTSWGTMGILLPAMIPLAYYLTQGDPSHGLILLLCFGAVLDGAIFGDHCSPISDTTVMSSISASCDHLDHVRTQLPYAMTTMTFAAGFGYVGVALGLPTGVALALGAGAILAVLLIFGKRPEDTA